MISPNKIHHKQLSRLFLDINNNSQEKFCFLLGAGASKSSGIPTGAELAKHWYEELKQDIEAHELERWQQRHNIDEERLAEFYPQIYEYRFGHYANQGDSQLQAYMTDAEPNIGYSLLAQILEKSQHKFVITTNFDHMVEDAIRSYTNARPLVCGHEFLASYVNAHSQRPTIIKVHRDLLLEPFNDAEHTGKLASPWQSTLEPVLKSHALVVLGYGGNDGSLMNYLAAINERKPIYWCYRSGDQINPRISELLKQSCDRLVEIAGFDEFMLSLNASVFNFPSPIDFADLTKSPMVENALARAERYKKQFEQVSKQTTTRETDTATNTEQRETAKDLIKLMGLTEEQAKDWWQWQLKINAETNVDEQQRLYLQTLSLLPNSAGLMGNYAIFLKNIRKDYEQAEHYFREALAVEPDNSINNGNYALFLATTRKDYEQAEQYYSKALALRPDAANLNGSYALFLKDIRKDYEQAEQYYRKALALTPDAANLNGSYALFLTDIRKDYEQAEQYYRKALAVEPDNAINNGNYAGFLLAQGKKAEAELYLNIAIASNHSDLLLECWFYRLAHFPEYRTEALQQIEGLLAQGERSVGWDFSDNIAQAEREGYMNIDELKILAQRINSPIES